MRYLIKAPLSQATAFQGLCRTFLLASVALVFACSGDETPNNGETDSGTDASEASDTATQDLGALEDLDRVDDALDTNDPEDAGEDGLSGDTSEDETGTVDEWAFCDVAVDMNCLQIVRGESVYYQRISKHQTLEFDDKGTPRTVVRLADLIEVKITDEPDAWRYQIFGSDGFTFGGYATWDQMMGGYMEVGTRRVVWEPALELPDSWRVKDSTRIELSPAGGR